MGRQLIYHLMVLLLLFFATIGHAQNNNREYTQKDFQITLIHPLGSNGMNSGNCINKFSLNLLAGYQAGTHGLEMGGILNINHAYMNGAQLSGFMNIVSTQVTGLQLAGFSNLAENLNGIQLAGFLNVAKEVQGVQLGIINVTGSIQGVPLGLLSIVEEGYQAFEFWGGEALHINFAYKMGVPYFYNIFSFGSHFIGGLDWGFGYGIGSKIDLDAKHQLSFDIIHYQINELITFFRNTAQLNQVRLNFGFPVNAQNTFIIGPTYNFLVSSLDNGSYRIGEDIAPYHFYEKDKSNTNYKMWIGLNAGFRF